MEQLHPDAVRLVLFDLPGEPSALATQLLIVGVCEIVCDPVVREGRTAVIREGRTAHASNNCDVHKCDSNSCK